MTSLLVLGLGNVLCSDDGVGVVAVSRLARRYHFPDDALLLDGGTLGLSLLPHLRAAESVLLLDAVAAPLPAGSLVRIAGADVGPAVAARLSPHQIGVADLLDGARLLDGDTRRIVLLGLVPSHVELGRALTPPVDAALDALLAAAVTQASDWGFVPRRRDDAIPYPPPHDVARVLGL